MSDGGIFATAGRGRNIGLGAMTDKLFFVNGQRATKAGRGSRACARGTKRLQGAVCWGFDKGQSASIGHRCFLNYIFVCLCNRRK